MLCLTWCRHDWGWRLREQNNLVHTDHPNLQGTSIPNSSMASSWNPGVECLSLASKGFLRFQVQACSTKTNSASKTLRCIPQTIGAILETIARWDARCRSRVWSL